MKKLLLLACLTVALAPHSANTEDYDRDDPKHFKHLSAYEMAGIGVGAAASIGAAGHLLQFISFVQPNPAAQLASTGCGSRRIGLHLGHQPP
jgi:hypothetical protein